jgi:hypothetical protein
VTLSREALLERAAQCPATPVAVDVFWDGDTGGWFVVLVLVYVDLSATKLRYGEHDLTAVGRSDVDPGFFNGEVPLWPEAAWVSEVGKGLADHLGVPFYFPSPHHPEDGCPRWWEQDEGYPCRRCGIPLLQQESCPWRGVCYFCHLAEEHEQREAQWTPEERAGPRCQICGRPATGTLGSLSLCADCLERYEMYQCSRCGETVMIARTEHHTDMCVLCELQRKIDGLPETQREALRHLAQSGRPLDALDAAERLLDIPFGYAELAISMLTRPRASE